MVDNVGGLSSRNPASLLPRNWVREVVRPHSGAQVRQAVALYPRFVQARRLRPDVLKSKPDRRPECQLVVITEPTTSLANDGAREGIRPDSPCRIDHINRAHPQSSQLRTGRRELFMQVQRLKLAEKRENLAPARPQEPPVRYFSGNPEAVDSCEAKIGNDDWYGTCQQNRFRVDLEQSRPQADRAALGCRHRGTIPNPQQPLGRYPLVRQWNVSGPGQPLLNKVGVLRDVERRGPLHDLKPAGRADAVEAHVTSMNWAMPAESVGNQVEGSHDW